MPSARGSRTGKAFSVAAGLGVQGATTYVALILAGRLLGAAEFSGLAGLYVLISSVATGLFVPLEQEISRRRGRERQAGVADPTLTRRAVGAGLMLSLAVVALALALHEVTLRMMGGNGWLLVALCVGLPGYALCFVTRGGFAGSQRLVRYGGQLAVEGAFRLVALIILAVVGVRSTAAYGLLFGAASWVALGVSLIPVRGRRPAVAPAPPDAAHPFLAPLGLLLVSSLAAQMLIGAAPLVAQAFSGADDGARIGAFLAALVVVRIPVFMFSAVQPSLLPTLAAHVQGGRVEAFRSLVVKVLGGTVLAGLVMIAGTAVAGAGTLTFLFGADYALPWNIFLLMGASVGFFLLATVLSQVVLSLGRHRWVAAGWIAGLAGLAIGTMLSGDAVLRATLGLMSGAAAAAGAFGVLLALGMRRFAREIAEPQPAAGAVDGQPGAEPFPPAADAKARQATGPRGS